jgi:hypothetical protein
MFRGPKRSYLWRNGFSVASFIAVSCGVSLDGRDESGLCVAASIDMEGASARRASTSAEAGS